MSDIQARTIQPSLFEPEIRVDCFFGCGYIVREFGPVNAHDSMEAHYGTSHRIQLDRIVGSLQ